MTDEQLISAKGIEEEGGLELGQIFSVFRRRIFLIAGITTVVATGAVLKALVDKPTYEASFEILSESVTLETRIISNLNPETLSNQENLEASVDEAKLRILKSPRVLEPIVQALNSQYPRITYRSLFNNLTVKPTSEDILVVSYRGLEPGIVNDVLEEVSNAYIEFSLRDRQSDIQRGITFVDEQLPQLRDRVNLLQSDLESLRQENNLIDPLLEGEQLSSQIGGLQQEKTSLNVQLDEAQQLYTSLQQELNQNGALAAATVLVEDPRYSELLDQVLGVDSQIAQQSALLLEESPEIQTLQAQRENLIPLVQQEGQRIQQLLASRIRELSFRGQAVDDAIQSLNQRIQQLSSVARQYSDIQRELEIATDNLNEFLTQRESLRIEIAQRQAPWELLTQPGRPRASVASAKRNLVLGTVLGLLIGTGVALVIDKFSSLVRTPKEIKEITRLPLLGIIPLNQLLRISYFYQENSLSSKSVEYWLNKSGLTVNNQNYYEANDKENSYDSISFTESFRSLYINIRLSNPDNPISSLTVSSSTPNEGKTTIATNLAKAAASMNRRVLIVDTDLRRPSIHKYLELDNQRGLTDLVSTNLTLSEVVQKSSFNDNLFALTSGSIPPNPSSVLASKVIQDLHEEAQQEYDLVIYDTPPIVGFSDTYLVANSTQGLLLVVGLDKARRGDLNQVIDELRVAKIPVLGAVANMADEQNNTSYSYSQQEKVARPKPWLIVQVKRKISRSVSNLISSKRD